MSVDTKAIGVVEVAIKSADPDTGTFEAILSAPTLDRDGEIVDGKAFDPLPEWIPIDIDHRMDVRSIVGSGQPYYDGDILKFKGSFASTPAAQEVRALVMEGHIRRMSVTFMNPRRETRDGVPHVMKGELINAAIVAIPANREAAITAAKAAGDLTPNAQQVHDQSVAAGATCKHAPTPDPTIDPEGKDAAAAASFSPADMALIRARAELDEMQAFLA